MVFHNVKKRLSAPKRRACRQGLLSGFGYPPRTDVDHLAMDGESAQIEKTLSTADGGANQHSRLNQIDHVDLAEGCYEFVMSFGPFSLWKMAFFYRLNPSFLTKGWRLKKV